MSPNQATTVRTKKKIGVKCTGIRIHRFWFTIIHIFPIFIGNINFKFIFYINHSWFSISTEYVFNYEILVYVSLQELVFFFFANGCAFIEHIHAFKSNISQKKKKKKKNPIDVHSEKTRKLLVKTNQIESSINIYSLWFILFFSLSQLKIF